MRAFLLVLFGVGCGSSYVPGSILADDAPYMNARRAGCVDLVAGTRRSYEMGSDGVLVWIRFGNRCDHAASIDFTKLRVFVGTGDEASFALTAFDPRQEIHAAAMEAHATGTERIEFYHVPHDATHVCVDWVDMVARESNDGPTPESIAYLRLALAHEDCVRIHPFPIAVALMVALPMAAHASSGCHETSESRAVGRTTCSRNRFGDPWEQPRGPYIMPSFEVDEASHLLLLANRSFDLCGKGGNGCPVIGQASGASFGARVGWTTGVRLGLPFVLAWGPVRWTPAYLEFGGGAANPSAIGTITDANVATSLGVVHALGHFLVRADLPLGIGSVGTFMSSSYKGQAGSLEGDFVELTPRLGVDFFVTPFWSVGLFAAADVLHGNDFSGGLAFHYTTRPYQGGR